jgi:hypothetical protein
MGYGRDEIAELTHAGEDVAAPPAAMPPPLIQDEAKLTQLYWDVLAGKPEAAGWYNSIVIRQKAGDKNADDQMHIFQRAASHAARQQKRHQLYGG